MLPPFGVEVPESGTAAGPDTAPAAVEGESHGRRRTPREWCLDLPMTAPLSMNDRQHYMVKHRAVAKVRKAAEKLAWIAQIPALEHFTVELHYAPRDARRRDPENLFATLKPVVDGIVDAGVAPDDNPDFYTTTVPVIDPPTHARTGRMWAIVREVRQ